MSADKFSRPAPRIKDSEFRAAAAGAKYGWIPLVGGFALTIAASMHKSVMRGGLAYPDIFRAIVRLLAIDMVNLFAPSESPSDLFLGHDSMLIGVAAHVGKVMVPANPN